MVDSAPLAELGELCRRGVGCALACHFHTDRATSKTRITAAGSLGRGGACALLRRPEHRPWCSTPTSESCASTTRRTVFVRSAGGRRPTRRCACCELCATRRSAATAAAPWWAQAAAHVKTTAQRLRPIRPPAQISGLPPASASLGQLAGILAGHFCPHRRQPARCSVRRRNRRARRRDRTRP